jgi:hypothetical protein
VPNYFVLPLLDLDFTYVEHLAGVIVDVVG